MNLSSVEALLVLSTLANIVLCSDNSNNYTGYPGLGGGAASGASSNHEMTKKLRRYKVRRIISRYFRIVEANLFDIFFFVNI